MKHWLLPLMSLIHPRILAISSPSLFMFCFAQPILKSLSFLASNSRTFSLEQESCLLKSDTQILKKYLNEFDPLLIVFFTITATINQVVFPAD